MEKVPYEVLDHSITTPYSSSKHPHYKPNDIKPPLHHEHQRKNNGWPNLKGKILESELFLLGLALDGLVSHTIKAPAKKRNSMKRAQAHIRKRIQTLIDEIHKKAALWLAHSSKNDELGTC
ncbi:1592_t:CDS:2 [Dentiscutata erythropus]|uniref:1592_t:CDS:1 n=1 Tax=Dentiscutata erythropus TaxID=1348616 RepID=A0A9N9H121_9GLOM|nr:1592_t:CDS:2 [Dentiscutata erythropus]